MYKCINVVESTRVLVLEYVHVYMYGHICNIMGHITISYSMLPRYCNNIMLYVYSIHCVTVWVHVYRYVVCGCSQLSVLLSHMVSRPVPVPDSIQVWVDTVRANANGPEKRCMQDV